MTTGFREATRTERKLRMAIVGPSGSGKTWTALTFATELGERVAVIDTERGSASDYANDFDFSVRELGDFSPEAYVDAIHKAENAGFDVLVIDSISHEWAGVGGVLDLKTGLAARTRSSNVVWAELSPRHNRFLDAICKSSCHVIVTMRAETHYIFEKDEDGKQVTRRIGTRPIQRREVDYEFGIVATMDSDQCMRFDKSRCPDLCGRAILRPGRDVACELKAWLRGSKDGRAELRRVLEEVQKEWGDVVGLASDLLGRDNFSSRALSNREALSVACAIQNDETAFAQRDAEPLPDEEQAREEAVELLARTRADLGVTPQKAGVIAKNHFGRSIGELNAAEMRELCTVIEKEAARD